LKLRRQKKTITKGRTTVKFIFYDEWNKSFILLSFHSTSRKRDSELESASLVPSLKKRKWSKSINISLRGRKRKRIVKLSMVSKNWRSLPSPNSKL